MNSSALIDLLSHPWPEPAEFSKSVARLERTGLQSEEEAHAYATHLKRYVEELLRGQERPEYLHPLVSFMQEARTPESERILEIEALPVLYPLYDFLKDSLTEQSDDALFLLKIFVIFSDNTDGGLPRLLTALQESFAGESYVWGVIFEHLTPSHRWTKAVCDMIRSHPPENFCGICALDLANELAEHGTSPHLFDSETGIERLQGWLESDDPDEDSYAESAVLALPYLKRSEAPKLLREALDHDAEPVQLVTAEILARSGEQAGFEKLHELALFPPLSTRACEVLQNLNRKDLVPAECVQPDFAALAQMCAWLADEDNFGEIPDDVEMYALKRIFWPPTNDEREFRFFKYIYLADCSGEETTDEIGVGMVGSQTCSLVGHTTPEMPLEYILALHCCWELQQRGDPRAPALLSVQEGLALLKLPKSPD
ncbi:MAG: hypothetical protein U0903_02035 [Planctomycetales bacterium]